MRPNENNRLKMMYRFVIVAGVFVAALYLGPFGLANLLVVGMMLAGSLGYRAIRSRVKGGVILDNQVYL